MVRWKVIFVSFSALYRGLLVQEVKHWETITPAQEYPWGHFLNSNASAILWPPPLAAHVAGVGKLLAPVRLRNTLHGRILGPIRL